MLRKYIEQSKINDFESMNYSQRRSEVEKIRKSEILRLQRTGNSKQHKQAKKNYRNTEDYIHLTFNERRQFINEIAACVSSWGFARLFAECIDKIHFDPSKRLGSLDEQAFEQLVSRFEQYLEKTRNDDKRNYGLLIHDNNPTVARKHTELMKSFHKKGTPWTDLKNIIETPLFVDSELTSLIQIADLCSYSIRRYLENDENELFDLIFQRADRSHANGNIVGVRHFSVRDCGCKICAAH